MELDIGQKVLVRPVRQVKRLRNLQPSSPPSRGEDPIPRENLANLHPTGPTRLHGHRGPIHPINASMQSVFVKLDREVARTACHLSWGLTDWLGGGRFFLDFADHAPTRSPFSS